MKQRKYFDINCAIGRKNKPDDMLPYHFDVLTDDMAYARVHGALISNNESTDCFFTAGDKKLIEITQKNERLFGIATLPSTGIFESGDPEYLDKLFDAGMRGVKIAPSMFCCSASPQDMAQIAEKLIQRGLPLFYPAEEGFEALAPLLDAYRELNIVVLGSRWGDNRRLFPLLEHYPSLHFDYSLNQGNDLLELTKKHFGIERVLFGTSWPKTSMAAMKSLNEYAVISEDDKDAVAYKNACRLLKINPDDLQLYSDADCKYDEIALAADGGLPMPVPVTDAHTHAVPEEYKTTSKVMILNSSAECMVEKLNRLGVQTAVTAPWEGCCTDGLASNDYAVFAANKFTGRFLAYNCCNVNYAEDLCGWQEYLDKYPDVFVGIKPYWVYQQFSLLDESVQPWLEYANQHKLALLLHTGWGARIVDEVPALAERYKDITFILAHSGQSYKTAKENIALIKKYSNVVAEITATDTTRGMIEYLVSEIGADRVLYGSDMPLRDPATQLGWVAYAKISYEDKCKILNGNIRRLIDKCLNFKK